MNILVLNGSPRMNGNTLAMCDAFRKGAQAAGHTVSVVDVARKDIHGCVGCDFCRIKESGTCYRDDDFQKLAKQLTEADMLVLASPVYYFSLSAQLQAAIQRCHCFGKLPNIHKMALMLSSHSDNVYESAIAEYRRIADYWEAEDTGVLTAYGEQNQSPEKMQEIRDFAGNL